MNYPELKDEKIISFDIETYDPELIEKGTGVYRKDGNILGVSIKSLPSGHAEYYNIGHRGVDPETKSKNINYLKNQLSNNVPKLGANIMYDMDWLQNVWDFKLKGRLHDVQVAEPLLDENKYAYNLDSLGKQYLGRGKVKTQLEELCEEKGLKGDIRKHLWMFSHEQCYDYAIGDVDVPLDVFRVQRELLKEQDLWDLYLMEMELFPLLLQMRQQGARLNMGLVDKGTEVIHEDIKVSEKRLFSKYGTFNVKSGKQIANIFDSLGVEYPLTAKGNPNLDKDTLPLIDHPIVEDILHVRGLKTILNTFFINSFTHMSVNGRIHCNFNPLKKDDSGTISGRFSSTKPNLQQIPANELYGKMCRDVFIPEEGHIWTKLDYSQIEYRIISHYATGPKSAEVRRKYNEDPNTDYHQLVMDWTGLNRKDSKSLNFGASYAMGAPTCARTFGWTLEKSKEFLERYHTEVPFIKTTRKDVTDIASRRGFIKTILNRRARVTQIMRDERKLYSMFNRLVQGSAADAMKKAMVDAYKAGIYEVLKPHLTVHDELDQSAPPSLEGEEALMELKDVMEKAIKFRVPLIADVEIGTSWGTLKDYSKETWEALC